MKRFLNTVLCVVLILCLTLTGVLAEGTLLEAYEEAMGLMLEEKYTEAVEKFEALGAYSDAQSMVYYCRALDCARQENYDDAILLMKKVETGDSDQMAIYYEAMIYEKAADEIDLSTAAKVWRNTAIYNYRQAYALYSQLDFFKDAGERAAKCARLVNQYADDGQEELLENREEIYLNAMALMKEEKWDEAIAAFEIVKPFRASSAKQQECYYLNAMKHWDKGDLGDAIQEFSSIQDYRDGADKVTELRVLLSCRITNNDMGTFGLRSDGTVAYAGTNLYGLSKVENWTDITCISAAGTYVAGIRADGTVVAVGSNSFGQCEVDGWTDMIAIATNDDHMVGLRSDGTVLAVGNNDDGQCDVGEWTDIVAIDTNDYHTVGLKKDGSVVATGRNDGKQCDVTDWIDIKEVASNEKKIPETANNNKSEDYRIIAIQAGRVHTVALRKNGTLLSTGYNTDGQCNTQDWSKVVSMQVNDYSTIGLKSDGSVWGVGLNTAGQCDVSNWQNILSVSASPDHTVGVKKDGTVAATGYNAYGQCNVKDWNDVIYALAGSNVTVGLKKDGTVVAVGNNEYGQCEVSDWHLW